ncbi:MAG: hypothetical protein M1308_16875 [Actinobacteria bacterium]|nr:hypothetical protein [Actinomycetota bacterium]
MYFLKNKYISILVIFMIMILVTLFIPSSMLYAAGSSIDAISITPGSSTVYAGDAATYTITLNPNSGFKSLSVSLSVTGLPAGCTASFSPSPVT